jgi:ABC-2 type transport system ATP-binding protein
LPNNPNLITEFCLQARGLTKFFGQTLAVDHLSLEIPRGEIFGFLGPNGAGKTTSIQMMVGLLAPTSGDVLIEGQSIRTNRLAVCSRIGVCPQENILWEKLTCLEQLEFTGVNYGMAAMRARKRGKELLASLGLAGKTNELAGKLSGGMKRRLNLALALIHDPQLVFLDEPEAGLDPQSRVLVRDTIRLLARQKTVVLTTHNMDEADRLAERIAIIDHGRLLVVDTPERLKRLLGEKTILEVDLISLNGGDLEPAKGQILQNLQLHFPDTILANHQLIIQGVELSARLPDILTTIQAAGCQASSIHIRAVTLEDVFLSLTGRGLRE